MGVRKPESPWSKDFRAALRELAEIRDQLEPLYARRKAILDEIPIGVYHLVRQDIRVTVTETKSASVSIVKLRNWVSDEVIRRCRTHVVRKVIKFEPLNKETEHG